MPRKFYSTLYTWKTVYFSTEKWKKCTSRQNK